MERRKKIRMELLKLVCNTDFRLTISVSLFMTKFWNEWKFCSSYLNFWNLYKPDCKYYSSTMFDTFLYLMEMTWLLISWTGLDVVDQSIGQHDQPT